MRECWSTINALKGKCMCHKSKYINVIASMFFTFPMTAYAGFIDQYSGWKEVSDVGKAYYAMGVFDQLTNGVINPDLNAYADSVGITKCASRLRIKAGMLVEAIDSGYRKSTKNWSYPPRLILQNELVSLCKADINRERRQLKLELYTD
jgi:hypothetical protein